MTADTANFGRESHPGRPSGTNQVVMLVLFLALCLGAGWLGSLATMPQIPTWYAGLTKPAFTPPHSVFPFVWTALYVIMAIAAWMVWRADAIVFDKRAALFAFLVQLALNVGWSYAFFALRSPTLGVGVIVILWIAIVWTVLAFRLVSVPAALLMLPYLAWVTFAGALNIGIALLN